MKLLVDAGNSRLKWRLDDQGRVVSKGIGALDEPEWVAGPGPFADKISGVAVSTVASEGRRLDLASQLARLTSAPVRFHWAEPQRSGLVNGYTDCQKMGADRWHAMYAAWRRSDQGVAVVDAGSAVTVDYVSAGGQHLGGFILPGLQMMVRSLRTDAARIGFDPSQALDTTPGLSTTQCVNHGLAWLTAAMVGRIHDDVKRAGLRQVLVTGGDADRLVGLGLNAVVARELVLDGLALIDEEDQRP